MDGEGKGDLIKKVESQKGRHSQILRALQIPRSTYYQWRKAYEEEGIKGLEKGRSGGEDLEPIAGG
jgi:transposase-like protein